MNNPIHDEIISAAHNVILAGDDDNKIVEWRTILRTVHEDMSRQSFKVLNGTMFEALKDFREYKSFDEWASAWRVKQFLGSGSMMGTSKSAPFPTFLFNASEKIGDVGRFDRILEENPAFSTSHCEMLSKYKQYKRDLSGSINTVSRPLPKDVSELSELTSCFLQSFKILMGKFIMVRLFDRLAGLTVKTFLEYIAFLIEETNFTTPIGINSKGSTIFEGQKNTMAHINYPQMFNEEKYGKIEVDLCDS